MIPARVFDTANTRDLTPEAIGPDGRLRILPSEFWENTTVDERAVFGNRHAVYGFPTIELVEWLTGYIGGRKAIEIGAGSGVLAEALGIPATDSHQQDMPVYREFYAKLGQKTVTYGPNVEKLDALQAVRKYRPQVVIGSWITHIYDEMRDWAGGNELGVDEGRLLELTPCYIHIGNEDVHKGKEIWSRPHRIDYPPFLYSRAFNGSRDFLAIW